MFQSGGPEKSGPLFCYVPPWRRAAARENKSAADFHMARMCRNRGACSIVILLSQQEETMGQNHQPNDRQGQQGGQRNNPQQQQQQQEGRRGQDDLTGGSDKTGANKGGSKDMESRKNQGSKP
ncbi:MAG TPA: hypothetical protein VHU87_08595 [Rhizomicrobium sp.]|nr:hypothetical protein [Rhizomicrobium sp.]